MRFPADRQLPGKVKKPKQKDNSSSFMPKFAADKLMKEQENERNGRKEWASGLEFLQRFLACCLLLRLKLHTG
ncbi:MAG: hypothetical protein LBL94_04085 [Prevotellaceae bacterium]|nr:hypothetical protein [Prevotellaceae bacterium]